MAAPHQESLSPQPRRKRNSFVPSVPTHHEMPTSPSSSPQKASLLAANYEPLDALCQYLHVSKVDLRPGASLPNTLDMPVFHNVQIPTHALTVFEAHASSQQPIVVPIDARLYSRGFRVEIIPPPSTGAQLHIRQVPQSHSLVATTPVVPLTVPHTASIPLLLLFGLGFETQINVIAWRLLPPEVIGEFPNAAAMAQVMARLSDQNLCQYVTFNHGLWKNILALGLRDTKIVELVQTIWNVTAEARRIQQRGEAQRQSRR